MHFYLFTPIYKRIIIRYKEKYIYAYIRLKEGVIMPDQDTKVSKAQQKAVNKYVKNNYDRINVTFPKGYKAIIQEKAGAAGLSVNEYIKQAVQSKIDAE